MYFWGIVFFVTTTLIMLFKHEDAEVHAEEELHGVWGTYKQLLRIVTLPHVFQYALILLTCKVSFVCANCLYSVCIVSYVVSDAHLTEFII